jgi:phosphohistidine phosphatase SixA
MRFALAIVAAGFAMVQSAAAENTDAAWRALAGDGAVALVRHAQAPGPSPDPPGFRLEDCATQRNLSVEGRAQAARLGALWREKGAKLGMLLSSPWCRCRDTARLAGWGEPVIENALWNLVHQPPDRVAKIARTKELIRSWRGPGALVLVTHGVITTAITGSDPGQAGIIVLMPDAAAPEGFRRVGTIPPP